MGNTGIESKRDVGEKKRGRERERERKREREGEREREKERLNYRRISYENIFIFCSVKQFSLILASFHLVRQLDARSVKRKIASFKFN